MKKIFSALFMLICTLTYAQNGLECVVVEKYYISDANDTTVNEAGGRLPVGSVTYRIYADMLPGYTFQAAYGIDVLPTGTVSAGDHELRLQTSTLFFNNQDRGSTSPTFTKSRCADNTVMLDSWLSVGAAAANNFGILKSKDNGVSNVVNGDDVLQNNDAAAGIPLTTQDGLIAGSPQTVTPVGISNEILVFDNQNDGTNGPVFATYNGSWASLTGSKGPDTTENMVLIAQITTDGIFSFDLNLQIGTPDGNIQRYVAHDPVGAEITLPCLSDTFGLPEVTTPPTVSITSPTAGASYIQDNVVNITADATAPSGTVTQVEFFVDGNSVGVDATAPYTGTWAATVGNHSLTAVVTDSKSAKTTSAPIAITVTMGTGVNNLSTSAPVFSVYPNPSTEVFNIQIIASDNKNSSYTITDIQGNTLMHKNIGVITGKYQEAINMSSFAAGIYFVEVSTDGFTATQKLIKN